LKVVYTEFNIEGNPQHNFIDLVLECMPEQVTLVPDAIGAITSSAGWDTVKIKPINRDDSKVSMAFEPLFLDPSLDMIEGAKTDRINYTLETFAHQYGLGNQKL
jgi:pyridoxine 5-phosphate synthase